MNDEELERFEERLRRFRTEAPPEHLRERILSGRPRFSWRSAVLQAAAVVLLVVSVFVNRAIEANRSAGARGGGHEARREGAVIALPAELSAFGNHFGAVRFVPAGFELRQKLWDTVREL